MLATVGQAFLSARPPNRRVLAESRADRNVCPAILGCGWIARSQLRDDVPGDLAGDVGQAEIAAGVAIGQLLVIEPHQRQQRGMQIGRVHASFDRVQAVFVGGAVRESALHARAGQPHRIAGDVVVAAVGALRRRQPAEFAAEEDERFVQQAALLEIGQQGGRRLIGQARSS